MKAASLFLGFTALVLVGTFAVLWQIFVPGSGPVERRTAARPAPSASASLRTAEPETNAVRSVYPGLGSAAPVRPMQVADERALRSALLAEPPPAQAAPEPPAQGNMSTQSTPIQSAPIQGAPAEVASADVAPAPREDLAESHTATDGNVDLNTATLEQLNGLGAGMIGRTIIANRPYTAPEDLVARRVLTRRDYEMIRPRVAAR